MRKSFIKVFELIDSGIGASELQTTLQSLRPSFKPLQDALKHLNQSQAFDHDHRMKAKVIAGIDEVGRGPLAGPLVAVCVSFSSSPPLLPFVRDSKKLQLSEREFLAPYLLRAATHVGYGVVEAHEFGKDLNLHQLTFKAMGCAIKAAQLPEEALLLIDGKFPLPRKHWTGQQQAVIGGDDKSFSIAAASILAKVYRDRVMSQAANLYPHYGFARHVGYPTAEHRQAILAHGACPIHRANFLRHIR